ncbi:MAG TPA: GIY-YIG nuclease family protein [Candidatus Kapabacteria bacterium]|nr:GIY-YIG nuclease family protein [Candidatus Kapabacteria bacterium]
MERRYFVYIMTNVSHTVFYTGMTNDLKRRIAEHRSKDREGFTKRYNAIMLVYYEIHDTPMQAIQREKAIKGGSRQKKIDLINSFNPHWNDLFDLV